MKLALHPDIQGTVDGQTLRSQMMSILFDTEIASICGAVAYILYTYIVYTPTIVTHDSIVLVLDP